MPGNAREHSRTDFFLVVKGKHVVAAPRPRQDAVRTPLPLEVPADAVKGAENPALLCGRPGGHAAMKRTRGSTGTGSPCSNRSASTRRASAVALVRASASLAP